MASNTKYNPGSSSQYSRSDLNANFIGILNTFTKNSTTNHDLLLVDDCLLDGAVVCSFDAVLGDKITFQVIDKDNIMGLGANTVLGQFITDWYINPNDAYQGEFKSLYPAKIIAGLYLRIKYTSIGNTTDPQIIVNYKLHKVLW